MIHRQRNEDSNLTFSSESLPVNPLLSVEAPYPISDWVELLKKLVLGFNQADFEQLKQQNGELQESLNNLNHAALKTLAAEVEAQLKTFDDQLHDPEQLTHLIVPCIIDVLNRKIEQSKAEVIQSLLPIIDELVRLKAQQNQQEMSQAIAALIPLGIQHQIKASPKTIAQAIAPEMGAAIQEQIRLDQDEIIRALAPTMGKTIQEQILLERDAMVDALYPVIGSTITRYLGEALQEIDHKIETALSFEGVKRKIRGKLQGVSEAELILKEVLKYQVQAIFLIHKDSGLLMTQLQHPDSSQWDSDMLAGMLTAIRSFVNDCVTNSQEIQELHEIEYGDSRILVEVAGYCYLAVIMRGEPTQQFLQQTRESLAQIIQNYSQDIQDFDGNPEQVPEEITDQLQPLMTTQVESPSQPQRRKFPVHLLLLLLLILGSILIPWRMAEAKRKIHNQVEDNALQALMAEPELALYRLNAIAKDKTLILQGKVSSQQLKQRVETVVKNAVPNWSLQNEVVAVKTPPNPEQVTAEVQRTTTILNQMNGVKIASQFDSNKVRVEGTVIQSKDIETVMQAFEQIEGVTAVNSQLSLEAFPITTRIYFKQKSAKIPSQDLKEKLQPIAEYLKQYPSLGIKMIGYSNSLEKVQCKDLGLKRSQAIQTVLEDYGIDRRRMEATQQLQLPPGVGKNQAPWLNQTVIFEIINQ